MILTKTDKTIKAFEKEIKRLLKEGKTAKEAVKEAYKKYPVMKTLEKELQKQLEEEMKRGAGEEMPITAIHDALSMVWSPDNLTLSERTTKGGKEITAQAASIIAEAIKKGKSVQKTALALFDGYGYGHVLPTQDIPEFMKKLSEIGRLTDYKGREFRKALRDVERQLKRVNVQGMKIAYGKIKEAIETGNEKKINKAVYVATQERTRYFARRIARTELARAYGDGAMAKWENDGDCVAFQWKLSTGHPFCDICDLYANADLYGMGKGIFPKDKVPTLPVHPNCMCHLRPVMSGSKLLKSETPKARIEEGGREWFAKQSLPNRQRILGVYGEKNVKAGRSWTEKARGYSGKYMKSRIPVIAKSLRPYLKDGKINIEEIAVRKPDENDSEFESRIWDYIKSPYCTKEFTARQAMHIKSDKMYVEGKSYYLSEKDIPIQDVVKWIRSGEIRIQNGKNWNKKVFITHPEIVAVSLNIDTLEEVKTNKSTIHVGNTGIHIVPRKG